MFGFLHHLTVFRFRELWPDIGLQLQFFEFHIRSGFQKLCHLYQFSFCLLIRRFQIIGHHSGDQQHFLTVMIKGNHLIEQHQIHIPEILLLFIFEF